MKKIKVDKVILYYMDRVDPDGNLYRFYVYKDMASEIEYFCTAEKIIKVEDSRKIDIIKRYLSEYEYLLDEMPKHDFKPFERVLVRRTNQERWKLHLFSRESGGDNKYECLGGVGFSQCIPYEGNEHLLGTNKN